MTTAEEVILTLGDIQTADGGFVSVYHYKDMICEDLNGFTVGLVLRALRDAPVSLTRNRILERIRKSALGFLLKCEEPKSPGAFGFWPSGAQPKWLREIIPPDTDDTAIYGLELARSGRLDREGVLRIANSLLARNRLQNVDRPECPWVRPGVFLTWLGSTARPQYVDCCLNTNVVAFLSFAGLTDLPGYREACAMIEAGIRWAGDSRERARSLSPFYPDPVELRYAVENAVQSGAESLSTSLALLHSQDWAMEIDATPDHIICGGPSGSFWTSNAVQIARSLVSFRQTDVN